MKTIDSLVIYGKKQPGSANGVEIYELSSSNRDAGNQQIIPLAANDKLLEFVFDDETTWICDAATLHELYPEAEAAKRSGDRSFELPGSISAPGAERGLFGSIVLKLLKVFAKKTVSTEIQEIAKRLEDKHLKHGVEKNKQLFTPDFEKKYIAAGAGLFRIDKNFGFSAFNGNPSNKPFFLFIHGTNSDTLGAYGDLTRSSAWATLHSIYGDNVIAFQHRTLTESPLENARKLATMLPDNITLHIISHSRGGIIGDIMNKYSSRNGNGDIGFSSENIELLKKEPGRERDIENIKALHDIFNKKNIAVTKFIRVACPAAGTKLASKRLDHILNAFFNIFGGSANPFADILKELVSAAVSSKDDTSVLPGVEAQRPESPFIKVLNDHSDKTAIDGSPLAVISGNGTVSFSTNGLLVILGKLFYWQRNDLVVNTDSMYLGAKRNTNIQYFFDQGADVNHVKYFINNKTCEAINLALLAQKWEQIPGFKTVLQNAIPASDRDDRGLEHGELSSPQPSGNKPIVVLLPGIMGSNIERHGKKYWLNYFRILAGELVKLEHIEDPDITAPSVVKTSYNKLYNRLSDKYDVVVYPFDWRKQLNDCAKDLDSTIRMLLQFGQPIKIIGHSMGGVLVRDFIINYDDTWKQLNSSKGFRIIFLGSPLGGSYRIPAVLFGQDSIISSLSSLDRVHTKKELLEMFVRFPGILSLLPIDNGNAGDSNFAEAATWLKMRESFGDNSWPLPGDIELKTFKNYQKNIVDKKDAIDYSNMVYIAGKDAKTPCGYYNDEIPPRKELVFLYTSEGDQSVTWELGIPKQMKAAGTVYYVMVSHGALANEPDMFDGIEDILEKGATDLFKKTPPVVRGEEKLFRAPADFNFDMSERGFENAILGIENKTEPVTSQVPVTVTVSNGDLTYASHPVLAGHFVNDGILSGERTIDANLNGMLTAKHNLGLYPGNIGTNEVFGRTDDKNFAGAVIIGLGEPGKLTSHELAISVEQGISNYLLSIKGQPADENKTGISALMIGCGWAGLSIESSIKAIIEGVNNANAKAISIFKNNCKTIQHIEFIELYLDRALSCMYALNKIMKQENYSYNINIGRNKITNLLGLRKRLPLDTSADWWNRVTVKFKAAKEGSGDPSSMVFGATTGEAREEENELFSSTPLIDLFIAEVSTQNKWSPSNAKTLFELMIPNGFKEKLKTKGNISWVLDRFTAAYPWELLQDNTVNAKPLCINAGMIRQLATADYRINIKRVTEEKALIIADPVLNGFINQLPGAAIEGKWVEEVLNTNGYPHITLINKESAAIVSDLFSNDYSIIHLAGHGAFNPSSPKRSGMVIGKDVFLTVFDIEQMTVVPELVFVNCCHLGKINAGDEKYFQNRYKLAANIGTELIKIGVKVVVAAGWAVNDDAALDFANTFYVSLFDGDNFGDAIKKARLFVYEKHPDNNTWGAYQCYGDPFYKLKKATKSSKVWLPSYIISEEAEIDLENLLNQLEMGKSTSGQNNESLKKIREAIEKANISTAQTTEKIAMIYLEMAMYKEAVEKFRELLSLEKANFSFLCMEKYCNARAKLYVHQYFGDGNAKNRLPEKVQKAIAEIDKVIADLDVLLAAGKTAERLNLLGSTYKRKAMFVTDKKEREEIYAIAACYFNEAGKMEENNYMIYSLTNAIELECILCMCGAASPGGEINVPGLGKQYKLRTTAQSNNKLEKLKAGLSKYQGKNNIDYWDMVNYTRIKLCQLLLEGKLSAGNNKWEEITNDFNTIWKKAGSEGKKAAEFEQIQFLTYAMATAGKRKGIGAGKKIKKGAESKTENLAVQIDRLRTAYNTSTIKISKVQAKPTKTKTLKKLVPKVLLKK